jgi:hypothetical protein
MGLARGKEMIWWFFWKSISKQHRRRRKIEKKYLRASEKYENFSGERLEYLTQL